jgi:hypothetical protein
MSQLEPYSTETLRTRLAGPGFEVRAFFFLLCFGADFTLFFGVLAYMPVCLAGIKL